MVLSWCWLYFLHFFFSISAFYLPTHSETTKRPSNTVSCEQWYERLDLYSGTALLHSEIDPFFFFLNRGYILIRVERSQHTCGERAFCSEKSVEAVKSDMTHLGGFFVMM